MALAPASAVVRRDGSRSSKSRSLKCASATSCVVRPGERMPVDGVVLAGESAVDQAPVTGESWPAERRPGDQVFAGTINGTGALEIEATRPASDSTIARIIQLVEHAQRQRAPVQTFVDRFARRYTPAVVGAGRVRWRVVPPLVSGRRGGLEPRLRRLELSRAGAAGRRVPVRARDFDAGVDRLGADRRRAPRRADQGRRASRAARRRSVPSRSTRPAR